jgi:hypothetical protein
MKKKTKKIKNREREREMNARWIIIVIHGALGVSE